MLAYLVYASSPKILFLGISVPPESIFRIVQQGESTYIHRLFQSPRARKKQTKDSNVQSPSSHLSIKLGLATADAASGATESAMTDINLKNLGDNPRSIHIRKKKSVAKLEKQVGSLAKVVLRHGTCSLQSKEVIVWL